MTLHDGVKSLSFREGFTLTMFTSTQELYLLSEIKLWGKIRDDAYMQVVGNQIPS